MDSLERRQLHLQEEIARNTERIADALEDLLKMHKRAQHCYIVHTDEQFNATIDIKKEETNND